MPACLRTTRAATSLPERARPCVRAATDPGQPLARMPGVERWHAGCTQSREGQVTVIDKLGFLVRFWQLKARHARIGQPLGAREQLELLSLMQLVSSDFRLPPPGPCPRPA